jgi:hypothetical protein
MKRESIPIAVAVMLVLAVSQTVAFDFQFERTSSSAGGFSIILPKPFTELPANYAINTSAASHPNQSFAIGGKPAPGVTFLATKFVFPSISDARSVVSSITTRQPAGFRRAYMKRADAAGLPGIEVKSISSSQVGYCRVLLKDVTVFTLTVEAPAEKDAEIEPDARRFLDSFALADAK